MRRRTGVFLGVLLAGIMLVASCLCASFVTVTRPWQALRLVSQAATATTTPVPTPMPTAAPDTAQVLASATVPLRDSRVLAERLRPGTGPVPKIVNLEPPRYAVGDKARFWVSNSDTREIFAITATLRFISQHATMWVEDGASYSQKGLERSAQVFDERIYPTVRRHFGSEWFPGVDNDPRVTVLNARFSGAAGYYSSHDEYSRKVNPYSNEREMFYMNIDAAKPGTERYEAILAHEFQHMVHWHLDANEDGWVNEGASDLAARLCGFGDTEAVHAFAQKPDTQLNAWALSPDEDTLPHYGASYLWMDYFMRRQGTDMLKAVLAEQANGIEGFEQVLRSAPGAPKFDDLFADWVAANIIEDPFSAGGRSGLQQDRPRMTLQATHRSLPAEDSGTVGQYATDYVALPARSESLRIEFWGRPTVEVVPNSPYEGRYQWWSNRGDMSNMTLTRAFDLSQVQKATLHYALWYELEDGWDYAYVEVSTDDGRTWQTLATDHTTDYNPNGNAFGIGYTGFSGHPAGSKARLAPQWIREAVDLTPYAGKRILLRFELITDDAVNLPGMCIDDISIPELGYRDDAESDDGGWQAEGFVRIDNKLSQRFLVQVIYPGQPPRVERLRLDGQQYGTLVVDGVQGGLDRVVLAISGLTRYTTEPASYHYRVSAHDPQQP